MPTDAPTTLPPDSARSSQIVAEVLYQAADVKLRASQIVVEALVSNTDAKLRSSQTIIEVLRERPPYDTTPAPTTVPPPTTLAPTTLAPTTLAPTTSAATTLAPTTLAPTTAAPTPAPTTTVTTAPPVATSAPATLPPGEYTGAPTTPSAPDLDEIATTAYPGQPGPIFIDNSQSVSIDQLFFEAPVLTKTWIQASQFGPEFFVAKLNALEPSETFPGFDEPVTQPPAPEDEWVFDSIGFIPDDV